MKNKIYFMLIVGMCIQAHGQNIHFLKSYGNTGYDYGRDILQTPDTGYIVTGSSSSFTSANADAFLLKVDSLGNFEWSYNYGGADSDWGMSVVVTHDSSYAIGGYTNSFGAGGFDFYLVRTDKSGIPIWEKTYGGSDWDKADALTQVAEDSGFVLVGDTYSYGAGNRDMYIVRTDKNGDTIWTKTYGGALDDYATGVLIDGDSIVVCGGTESYGSGMRDGIILKMDLDGNIGWVKVVGKPQEDYFTNIVKSSFYYCLSGSKSYTYSTDYNDFWVYKIFSNGTIVMADTTWDGDQFGNDIANDVVVEPLTNIVYYGGSTTSWGSADVSAGITDCFISKLDAGYGWMPYVQNFGDLGSDALYAMDYCKDKGLVAVGDLDKYSTGGNNVLIVKIDKNNSFGFITVFADVVFENITLTIADNTQTTTSIFPNPSTQFVHINSENDIQKILVWDAQGNCVHIQEDNQNVIDIGNLMSGIYFLQVIQGETISTFTIVKP